MKISSVLFYTMVAAVLLTACNTKAKRAKTYHDELLKQVQMVIDSSLDYGDALQTHDKLRATTAQRQYSALINAALEKVKNTGPFDGDTSLQHYSAEMLGYYQTTLQTDFEPLLAGVKDASFSDVEAAKADSLYGNMAMMESKYWERFNWAEKKFYKEHNIAKVEEK